MRWRRRAIPYIAQAEMADCGAAALAMALGYHGRHVSLAEMHEATGTGRDGIDALRLAEAATAYGLRARGVATELDDLRVLPRGTVLHWGAAHFVVLESTSRRGVTIVDPIAGRYRVTWKAVNDLYSGVAIMLEPTSSFAAGGRPAPGALYHARRMLSRSSGIGKVLGTSVVVRLMALAVPVLTGVVVDQIVPADDGHLLKVLAAVMAALIGYSVLATFLRARLLLRLRSRLDVDMTLGFLRHTACWRPARARRACRPSRSTTRALWIVTAALRLDDVPGSLLVVGGGYIGLSSAPSMPPSAARSPSSRPTHGLLPGVDRDLVRPLQTRLASQFHKIYLGTRVAKIEAAGPGIRAVLEGEEVTDKEPLFDRVLVSVGRKPNTRDLGLEKTRAKLDEKGFVQVDGQRRTEDPSIFAIGDVAGQPMLVHKAAHEGKIAVEAILGEPSLCDWRAMPAVVFTDPEIAWCGLTEDAATEARCEDSPFPVGRVRPSHDPWPHRGFDQTPGRSGIRSGARRRHHGRAR